MKIGGSGYHCVACMDGEKELKEKDGERERKRDFDARKLIYVV